jgi:hypothetical protein
MYDDPATPKYKRNPNYNPDLPEVTEGPDGLVLSNWREFVDETAGLGLALGKHELEYLRVHDGALNDCLRLLAKHRMPPPPWLAERMLAELPKGTRVGARTLERALNIVAGADRLKREKNLNREDQAKALNISKTVLDDLRAICKPYNEFEIDNME